MVLKRKWAEMEYDSDDSEPSLGRQVLPVAHLPLDFDQEPANGMEYLFLVRRDARNLPDIKRSSNFQQVEEPVLPPTVRLPHPDLPSLTWRELYGTRFKNFRSNLNQAAASAGDAGKGQRRRLMPDKKERDLWWAFLAGKPESIWNPPKKPKKQSKYVPAVRLQSARRGWDDAEELDISLPHDIHQDSSMGVPGEESEGRAVPVATVAHVEGLSTPGGSPAPSAPSAAVQETTLRGPQTASSDRDKSPSLMRREPSISLLQQIDEAMALHLLMYFTHWINLQLNQPEAPPQIRESHARWMFALLSRVDDYVSADAMNLLRNLARACVALLRTVIQLRGMAVQSTSDGLKPMSESSCWIILSTVVEIWKQRDLWTEAEDMLNGL